jgi:hypothetical protein
MNFEQRIVRFFREIIELLTENIWTFVFAIWILNGAFGFISKDKEQPKQVQQTEQLQKKEDGPKPSM